MAENNCNRCNCHRRNINRVLTQSCTAIPAEMVSLQDCNTASRAELALRSYGGHVMRRVNNALLFWRRFFLHDKHVNCLADADCDEKQANPGKNRNIAARQGSADCNEQANSSPSPPCNLSHVSSS